MSKNTIKGRGITNTGNNLSILITCDYTFTSDWQSFATWYSCYRCLPDADVALLCARELKDGYASFNWPYKCDIKFFQHNNVDRYNSLYATYVALSQGFLKQPLLVVDSGLTAVRDFDRDVLEAFNDNEITFGVSNSALFFAGHEIESFANILNNMKDEDEDVLRVLNSYLGEPGLLIELCSDSNDKGLPTFINCKEKCGNFCVKKWENKYKHICPFRFAQHFIKEVLVSTNERRVFNLWSQMSAVYDMVR